MFGCPEGALVRMCLSVGQKRVSVDKFTNLQSTVKPVRLHTSLHCTLVYIAHFLMHQLKQKAVFAPLYIAHLSTLHTFPCTEGVQCTQVSLYIKIFLNFIKVFNFWSKFFEIYHLFI